RRGEPQPLDILNSTHGPALGREHVDPSWQLDCRGFTIDAHGDGWILERAGLVQLRPDKTHERVKLANRLDSTLWSQKGRVLKTTVDVCQVIPRQARLGLEPLSANEPVEIVSGIARQADPKPKWLFWVLSEFAPCVALGEEPDHISAHIVCCNSATQF